MKPVAAAIVALLAAPHAVQATDVPIAIVAAQNVYGEVAAAVGGDHVDVESIVVSAEADPHDFEPPASVARAVSDAGIVVMNGAEYDHWMERLLDSSTRPDRIVIEVSELIGAGEGDNPHLWYDPRSMPALAAALSETLSDIDPAHADDYASRHNAFVGSLDKLTQKISDIRTRFAGAPVTATEPVFGPMADALGLEMRNTEFQRAIMNETEPSARQIAAFEDDLKSGQVKVLFYNKQVVDPLTERLLAVAHAADVPVVGVTESLPDGSTFIEWMTDQLDATERALAAPSS